MTTDRSWWLHLERARVPVGKEGKEVRGGGTMGGGGGEGNFDNNEVQREEAMVRVRGGRRVSW